MPGERACKLLSEWADKEPWKHYDGTHTKQACQFLCRADATTKPEDIEKKLALLRRGSG